MATNTRAYPQRNGNAGESSSSATIGEQNPNTPNVPETGHISELEEDNLPSGNSEHNPTQETNSHDQSGDEPQPTIDERIAQAIRRRDELAKEQQLQALTAEIHALERGEKRSAGSALEGAGPTKIQRNLRPKDLDIFHAKSTREHRNWVRDAEDQFCLTPQNFISDKDKILWCNQFLGDNPKEQYRNEAGKEPENVSTWPKYVAFLLNLIEDPVNRELDVSQAYADASQRQNQSVREFDAYLNSLEAQMLPYSEEQRTSHFFTKLRPEIRAAVTDVQTVPTRRNELVSLATRLENNRRRRNPASRGNYTSSQGGQRGGKQAKSGSTPANQQEGGQAHGKRKDNPKGTKGKAQSKEEKARKEHLRTIQCFNCKQMGHYANTCENPKVEDANSVPVGSVGNVQASAVPTKGKGKPSSDTPARRGQ